MDIIFCRADADFVCFIQTKIKTVGHPVSLLKKYLPRLPRKVQMLGNASLARLFACQTGVDDADVPFSAV